MSSADVPLDPLSDYPIAERRPDLIRSATGKPLSSITLAAVIAGEITAEDLRITAESLQRQATIAAASGRPVLVANFQRAAELTRVPDDRLLAIYESLRPRRSTTAQLNRIADELETIYDAPLTAALVREAAHAYERRGLAPEVTSS